MAQGPLPLMARAPMGPEAPRGSMARGPKAPLGSRAASRVHTELGTRGREATPRHGSKPVSSADATEGPVERVPDDFAERMGASDGDDLFERRTARLDVDRLWAASPPSSAAGAPSSDEGDADEDARDSSERWSDPEPFPEDDLPYDTGRFQQKTLATMEHAGRERPHPSAPPPSTSAASMSHRPPPRPASIWPLVGLGTAAALALAFVVVSRSGTPDQPQSAPTASGIGASAPSAPGSSPDGSSRVATAAQRATTSATAGVALGEPIPSATAAVAASAPSASTHSAPRPVRPRRRAPPPRPKFVPSDP